MSATELRTKKALGNGANELILRRVVVDSQILLPSKPRAPRRSGNRSRPTPARVPLSEGRAS